MFFPSSFHELSTPNAAMLIRNVYCNFCFLPHAPPSIAEIPPHTVPHASSSQQFANPIRDLRYGHARLHSFPRHPSTVSHSDHRFYFILFVQKACGHYNASSQLYIKQKKAFGKLSVYVQTFWTSFYKALNQQVVFPTVREIVRGSQKLARPQRKWREKFSSTLAVIPLWPKWQKWSTGWTLPISIISIQWCVFSSLTK